MAGQSNGAANPVRKATYYVYEEQDGGSLKPLGNFKGRNAHEAVKAYMEDKGANGGKPLVVVPQRNLSRVRAVVEHRKRVTLEAA